MGIWRSRKSCKGTLGDTEVVPLARIVRGRLIESGEDRSRWRNFTSTTSTLRARSRVCHLILRGGCLSRGIHGGIICLIVNELRVARIGGKWAIVHKRGEVP